MTYLSADEQQYIRMYVDQVIAQRQREEIRAFDAFCEWLNYAGFGWVVLGLRVGNAVWRGVRRLWRSIFNSSPY
jgi:hypothetical protein